MGVEAPERGAGGSMSRIAMAHSLRWGAVALLMIALGALALRPEPPPNVLLVTIDTLRADRLGAYGYPRAATPNLDRLAAEGAVFENAFCDVTWTAPSLASTLTGTYAVSHGLKSTYQQLDVGNLTLAERLRRAGFTTGYATGAVVGSFPASSIFGLGQGFESYDEQFNTPIIRGGAAAGLRVPLEFHPDIDEQRIFQAIKAENRAYRPDEEVTDAALTWLHAHRTERFFLWVHYFGPHETSDRSRPFFEEVNRMIAAYDGDVTRSDRAVGRLLDELRSMALLDRTFVVVHADHGQSLNEHQYFGHGKFLYDEVLRVPLIMRYPAQIAAGARVRSMARNVDIVPTVLAAAGAPADGGLPGRSLLPAIISDDDFAEGETYCETYLSATEAFATRVGIDGQRTALGFRRMGLRSPRWMFIRNEPWPFIDQRDPQPIADAVRRRLTSEELYDMAADPRQSANLVADHPETATTLRTRLAAYQSLEHESGGFRPVDERDIEKLRSLGYVE
jgi:arylsulfatase A-like enzyme